MRTPNAYLGAQRGGEGRGIAGAVVGRDLRYSCIASSAICASAKQRMLERLHSSDEDCCAVPCCWWTMMRENIFALSSVLERRGMEVLTATTGSEAIGVLAARPDVRHRLDGFMMPGKDGYETIQAIRVNPDHRRCRFWR